MAAVAIIERVAGTGVSGFGGDDGPATDTTLSFPVGVAVTSDGGFLIADITLVRKVSAAGMITRVAGTGAAGSSGDDGPAVDAQLSELRGIAVTPDGGFLISCAPAFGLSEVRKVSASGTITRVAGVVGAQGFSGDDGPATEAELGGPAGLAATHDGGFLIADSLNHVVRKVTPSSSSAPG